MDILQSRIKELYVMINYVHDLIKSIKTKNFSIKSDMRFTGKCVDGTSGCKSLRLGYVNPSGNDPEYKNSESVAVGHNAGMYAGFKCVSIGTYTQSGKPPDGQKRGDGCVSIGAHAGYKGYGSIGNNSVAIGNHAGELGIGENSINISNSGCSASIKNNTIFINNDPDNKSLISDGCCINNIQQKQIPFTSDDISFCYYNNSESRVFYDTQPPQNFKVIKFDEKSISFEDNFVINDKNIWISKQPKSSIVQNDNCINIGTDSVLQGQEANCISLGFHISENSIQKTGSVNIGNMAGHHDQQEYCVAIGTEAGAETQGVKSVAIGDKAGCENLGESSVVIGVNAGTQTFTDGVAIGTNTSIMPSSGCVSIGNEANNQGSINTFSIGYKAGYINGQGSANVYIGTQSNETSENGNNKISIGYCAGQTLNNTSNNISIGSNSGNSNKKENSISIGYNSGFENQGENSIAIGVNTGYLNQMPNSIIINADPDIQLNSSESGLFINPIRYLENTNIEMIYDETTGEIMYQPVYDLLEEEITGQYLEGIQLNPENQKLTGSLDIYGNIICEDLFVTDINFENITENNDPTLKPLLFDSFSKRFYVSV